MFNFIHRSIMRQLVVTISGTVAILLIVTSYFILSSVSDSTHKELIADIENIVTLQSTKVKDFFVAKGQINHSVFSSPLVIDWFSKYDERLSNISGDKSYQDVTRYFKYFSTQDPAIKSVFFGSENTHEYFDLNGRYDVLAVYQHQQMAGILNATVLPDVILNLGANHSISIRPERLNLFSSVDMTYEENAELLRTTVSSSPEFNLPISGKKLFLGFSA